MVRRRAFPGAAILLALAFLLSGLTPDATRPNRLINLAYLGAGLLLLRVGLVRARGAGAQPSAGGRPAAQRTE